MAQAPTEKLYRDHLAVLDRALADAVERAGRAGIAVDGVAFHAGRERVYHRDDEAIVHHPAAHFRRWVPPLAGPDHVVAARPGSRPKVVVVQPRDFWYEVAPPPASYWQDAVDLVVVERFEDVAAALGSTAGLAYAGPDGEAAAALGIPDALVEPDALMLPLDWHRAVKTPLEVAHLRRAAALAAAGHAAAREAFEAGACEREIHWRYLEGAGHLERELPYGTIVALDDKSAILHYQNKRGEGASAGHVLLVDAGAQDAGYAADITRTWTGPGADPLFRELNERMDAAERELVAMVAPGRSYVDIHLAAHRHVAAMLADTGIVTTSADEAFDLGLTRAFLPHGVGHHLGLQVHDVGGRQRAPEGGTVPPPEHHPFLRNTRTLEPGHVVTIEPGLYFIPLLLDPLRSGPHAARIDWATVDRLIPCGGTRIEDNVLCTEDGFDDLTRHLCPGP